MTIETRTAFLSLQGQLITISIKPNADIETEDATQLISAYITLRGDKPRFVLTDAGSLRYISPEAMQHVTMEIQSRAPVANAIIARTTSVRLIANFFIQFFKPPFPIKIFRNEQEALSWLEKFSRQD